MSNGIAAPPLFQTVNGKTILNYLISENILSLIMKSSCADNTVTITNISYYLKYYL